MDILEPMSLAMRLGAIVVASILLTLALGLWIDRRFGTSPFGLLCFMLLGVIVSIVGVYRAVQDAYEQQVPPKEGK